MKTMIYGRIFSDVADFAAWDKEKEYPHYAMESERTWEIDSDSLFDAEIWLAANHPESYMGGSIVCENGDFMMLAVPCDEYGTGNYETKTARRNYANYVAERGIRK